MIRDFIGFTLLILILIFGIPWLYYFLTGNLMEY